MKRNDVKKIVFEPQYIAIYQHARNKKGEHMVVNDEVLEIKTEYELIWKQTRALHNHIFEFLEKEDII